MNMLAATLTDRARSWVLPQSDADVPLAAWAAWTLAVMLLAALVPFDAD